MTIALGILATDGVVLAADTQVTVPGYSKIAQGKLSSLSRIGSLEDPACSLIISAAGAESSTRYVRQELTNWFHVSSPVANPSEVGAELKRQILEFHDVHVTPHGRDGALDVSMLVAAVRGNQRRLWTTNRSALIEENMFAAVGSGEMYARALMENLYAPVDTLGAIILAAYVIYEVKRFVDGCGGETQIQGHSPGKIYDVSRNDSRRLDDLFVRYSQAWGSFFRELIYPHAGFAGWPRPKPANDLRKMRSDLAKIIKSIEYVPDWTKNSAALSDPESPTDDQSPPQPSPE